MTTITALPDAPSRTDPSTFSSKSDALLGVLGTFVTETNTVAGEVNANAVAAAASASTATTQAGLATTNGSAQVSLAAAQVVLATAQANAAEASATAAAQASNAAMWVSGATYALGDVAISPIDFAAYRRIVAGAGATDPSADAANWIKAVSGGISAVTTATTATTLTSTATLLKITPASYGVAVTLPDATTCSVGGPLHIIDNKGAYPVRVLNSAGTLLGFIFAGVVSHVSLADNSTAAGVWTVENSELVGASAQLLTAADAISACISLDSSREILITRQSGTTYLYAVVYNKTSNTFGNPTLVRSVGVNPTNGVVACLSGTDQVLVVSCTPGTTAFEAVTLSISGTTITVNTAATATLSANISAFTDGCGLIAVGSSFVCSYTVSTPAAQIRALSISGTTVTIGSATVLDGTAGGLIALGDSTHVIAASTAGTHLYTKPYLVSGSTLTAGTGTDTNSGIMTLNKFAALGTRWYVGYNDGGATVSGGVVSLSGTWNGTTTITTATLFAAGSLQDAIIVGSDKVLALNNQTTNNANILTDTAGTASKGTAITLSSQTSRACLYTSGTDAYVIDGTSAYEIHKVSCSGASPVLTASRSTTLSSTQFGTSPAGASNAVLSRSPNKVYGPLFFESLPTSNGTEFLSFRCRELDAEPFLQRMIFGGNSNNRYRGKSDSERWVTNAATAITKMECPA